MLPPICSCELSQAENPAHKLPLASRGDPTLLAHHGCAWGRAPAPLARDPYGTSCHACSAWVGWLPRRGRTHAPHGSDGCRAGVSPMRRMGPMAAAHGSDGCRAGVASMYRMGPMAVAQGSHPCSAWVGWLPRSARTHAPHGSDGCPGGSHTCSAWVGWLSRRGPVTRRPLRICHVVPRVAI